LREGFNRSRTRIDADGEEGGTAEYAEYMERELVRASLRRLLRFEDEDDDENEDDYENIVL